jgi:glycosyltransferase involved in cell wall biosynthesis
VKILFISHRIPWPLKDGGSIAIYNNLKGLVDAGCQVKFLALCPDKDKTDIAALPDVFRSAGIESVALNTDVRPVPALGSLLCGSSYNAVRFYNKTFASLISKVLKQESFDLVHIEGAFAGQYVDVIRRISSVPCVLREHNVEYAIWERLAKKEPHFARAWYLRLLAARLRNYEENLWRKFDLVTAVTLQDLSVFRKIAGKGRVFMAGAGFDLDPYMAIKKELQHKTLFHLASMDWLPNQESVSWIIQEIWPEITTRLSGYKLFIAGKKMPLSFMDKNGGNLKIEAEVASATDYMADKEIMLVPLLSGSGIRIKCIEAMAMGKIIVSTELGHRGLGAVPGEHLLEANTTEEFIKALSYLEQNPQKKKEIGAAARSFVREHFDNRKVTERLLETYQKLLK